jgi:DNA polymerase-1
MRHSYLAGQQAGTAPIVVMVPDVRKADMVQVYCVEGGLPAQHTMGLSVLRAPGKSKKVPIDQMRQYLNDEVVPVLKGQQTQYVLVADTVTFKELTGKAKAEGWEGYVLPSTYGDFMVVSIPNYAMKYYDPEQVERKIKQAVAAVKAHSEGTYVPPGDTIFLEAHYPKGGEIIEWIRKLRDEMTCDLTADTETFSLKVHRAGIGTIAFSWEEGRGVAFPVDLKEFTYDQIRDPEDVDRCGTRRTNHAIRAALKSLFIAMRKQGRKLVWHNISYDVSVLISALFMDDILDTAGLLEGLDVMLTHWDCTQLITYLATNSTAGNKLGLKPNSQEYSGNYAIEEIKDITRIPLDKLLAYNLVDTFSTWYVLNKNKPIMLADNQEDFYEKIFKPSQIDIIQMQLTGMPVNIVRAREVDKELRAALEFHQQNIFDSPVIKEFQEYLDNGYLISWNARLKKQQRTLADVKDRAKFNPNSDDQLAELFYTFLSFPVLDTTESGGPATGAKTLAKLVNHTSDQTIIDLINEVRELKLLSKVISSFMPAILDSEVGPDGWHYLCGSFKLGGTISGRLSSSDPNMQNLPAGSKYGKIIKSIFEAPPGWIFCGLDFASLEDRISALTTKDPNKLKVYTDGYDGHSLRTYAYFTEHMIGIDPTSVASINSIQDIYPAWRGKSKAPTFALTYQGTYSTLMNNCGFDEVLAKSLEASFQTLYKVSIDWVNEKLTQASKDGYVTLAFGLRLRTPKLKQVVFGNKRTPSSAAAEGRSAGNALGQSWCLLNNRACSDFMAQVRTSEYRLDIRPCAQIHDAQYYLIRDSLAALSFTNDRLVKAVQWQDDKEIFHEEVKLGGELSIFYPTWKEEISIPNGHQCQDIYDFVMDNIEKRKK